MGNGWIWPVLILGGLLVGGYLLLQNVGNMILSSPVGQKTIKALESPAVQAQANKISADLDAGRITPVQAKDLMLKVVAKAAGTAASNYASSRFSI